MINTSSNWYNYITSPSRRVIGKVELWKGSTLASTIGYAGNLVSIKIEKTPIHGAFFGYSISKKAIVEVLDKQNDLVVEKGNKIIPYLGTFNNYEYLYETTFTVDDAVRDEVKKVITITAYDLLHEAAKHKASELNITYPINIAGYADAIAAALGTSVKWELGSMPFTDIEYTEAAPPNIEGTETLRELLDAIAQVTGSICYINNDDKICFKRLGGSAVTSIGKSDYFSLKISEPVHLTQVTSATQLGDNITAGSAGGRNHIFYDNPFLELYEDATSVLEELVYAVRGIDFYPYEIKWRGNPAIEIGDTITLQLEDDSTVNIIYLGETIKYTGGMSATSDWKETEQQDVYSTPSNLGEAVKQTYAKVDKVNKQINMVVSEAQANSEAIAALQLNTDSINASVTNIEKSTTDALEGMNEEVATLKTKVEATMTSEDVKIAIQSEMESGTNKVVTETGFTFDEKGLTVSKADSEMETTITEDGMIIYKNDDEVLVANNEGVKAKNLHATTFLIIGNYSRFEDYHNANGEARTGCFWIGD